MIKNIARFNKNPFAYLYWRFAGLSAQNRFRLAWAVLIFHLYGSFALYVTCKTAKEGMIHKFFWTTAYVNREMGFPHEKRMPADRKKNYVRYSNFHQVRRNKKTCMMHTNWWCRDQNFRKYFDMRKRHDIKPSLRGFYHEPIYEETTRKNQEWADLRASRQAR
jgi:hypothetical protein